MFLAWGKASAVWWSKKWTLIIWFRASGWRLVEQPPFASKEVTGHDMKLQWNCYIIHQRNDMLQDAWHGADNQFRASKSVLDAIPVTWPRTRVTNHSSEHPGHLRPGLQHPIDTFQGARTGWIRIIQSPSFQTGRINIGPPPIFPHGTGNSGDWSGPISVGPPLFSGPVLRRHDPPRHRWPTGPPLWNDACVAKPWARRPSFGMKLASEVDIWLYKNSSGKWLKADDPIGLQEK